MSSEIVRKTGSGDKKISEKNVFLTIQKLLNRE